MLDARRDVYVTGLGLATPFGGRDLTWQAIKQGRSGITDISQRFSWAERAGVAGYVDVEPSNGEPMRIYALARLAMSEAISHANLSQTDSFEVCLGNNCSELDGEMKNAAYNSTGFFRERLNSHTGCLIPEFGLASWLKHIFPISGAVPTLATNCVAGMGAISMAASHIANGWSERVIAGGVDCGVTPEMVSRFLILNALASPPKISASRPFDVSRNGFVIGDGAGFLVLESEDSLSAGGREAICKIGGWGASADANHVTRGSINDIAKQKAIRKALAMASVQPGDIRMINAHGTSTLDNDSKELTTFRNVLGNHLNDIPITAHKSNLGHSLGAAGAIELALSTLALRDQQVPPIINLETPEKEFEMLNFARDLTDIVAGPILKTAFAFGGMNSAIVLLPR